MDFVICGKCGADKPRASFPDSEWHKRKGLARYCTKCRKPQRTKNPDPAATWRNNGGLFQHQDRYEYGPKEWIRELGRPKRPADTK